MKTEAQIKAELDKFRDAVADGSNNDAETVWSALTWVLDINPDSPPSDSYI